MALDPHTARFLLYAKRLGVDFSQSAMIGRQSLMLNLFGLERSLIEFGLPFDDQALQHILEEGEGYAEGFLRYLGADDVHSFDRSDYEGATDLLDLNQEIPERYSERYSMVLDGGSLEHVFNFPVAIKNCLEMVQVGGHYLATSPMNNFVGHGFYQFSPELYSSIFSEVNGYQLVSMLVHEETPLAKWFSVVDPASVGARVSLINKVPTIIMVIAKRIQKTQIFEAAPQQIYYARKWDEPSEDISHGRSSPLRMFTTLIPASLKRFMRRRLEQRLGHDESGFDPRFFQPMEPADSIDKLKSFP